MVKYIIRRVLQAIPTLFAVLTLIFLLVRVAPGDPAVAALGNYASEQAIENLRAEMGLNQPLWKQYFSYLLGIFHGDLGKSLVNNIPVSKLIMDVFPYTLELTLSGMFIAIISGIPLGVLTALKRNTIVDYLGRIFSLMGLSIPAFYLGILLVLLFSMRLNILPVTGVGNGGLTNRLYHLVLPAFTLGIISLAGIARISRSSMLEVLNEDYIDTARSKGLNEVSVNYKHALRNALIPVVTLIGVQTSILIGSSVMTEIVFSRPGLGKLLIGAMKQRDYIVVQSLMTFYAGIVIAANLLVDVSYAFIDPQVKYD